MRIALISCVKEKAALPCRADEMYQGENFRFWFMDAENRQVDLIFILSGKYGLLTRDEIIEPYDLNLVLQSTEYINDWYQRVLKKLLTVADPAETHFIIYANETYHKGLTGFLKSYEIPIKIE